LYPANKALLVPRVESSTYPEKGGSPKNEYASEMIILVMRK